MYSSQDLDSYNNTMAHFHSVLPQQGVSAICCSWDSRTEPTAVRVSGPPQAVVAVVVVVDSSYVYIGCGCDGTRQSV